MSRVRQYSPHESLITCKAASKTQLLVGHVLDQLATLPGGKHPLLRDIAAYWASANYEPFPNHGQLAGSLASNQLPIFTSRICQIFREYVVRCAAMVHSGQYRRLLCQRQRPPSGMYASGSGPKPKDSSRYPMEVSHSPYALMDDICGKNIWAKSAPMPEASTGSGD